MKSILTERYGILKEEKRSYIIFFTKPDAEKLVAVIGGRVEKEISSTGQDEHWVNIPKGKIAYAKSKAREIAGRGSYKFYQAK